MRLQDELAGTENRIAVERKRYNDTLQDYNTYIQLFPKNIFAGWAGFKPNEIGLGLHDMQEGQLAMMRRGHGAGHIHHLRRHIGKIHGNEDGFHGKRLPSEESQMIATPSGAISLSAAKMRRED